MNKSLQYNIIETRFPTRILTNIISQICVPADSNISSTKEYKNLDNTIEYISILGFSPISF